MAEIENSNQQHPPVAPSCEARIASTAKVQTNALLASQADEAVASPQGDSQAFEQHDTEMLANSLREALDGLYSAPFQAVLEPPPILASLKNLRDYLSEFYEENLAPQPRLGFLQAPAYEIDFASLKTELESLYLEMQGMVAEQEQYQASPIDYASFAQHCAELTMNFLTEFDQDFRSGNFAEGARESLLLEVLNLRAGMTSVICELQEAELQVRAEQKNQFFARLQAGTHEGTESQAGMLPQVEMVRHAARLEALQTSELPILREIAKEIYQEAARFILQSRRIEPQRIGFEQSYQRGSELKSSALLRVLSQASERLEELYLEMSDPDHYGLQLQVFAQNIQTAADMLRLSLVRSDSMQTVAEADRQLITAQVQRAQSMIVEQSSKMSAFLGSLQVSEEAA